MWRQIERRGRRNLLSIVSLLSLLVALFAATTLAQAEDGAKFGIRPATTGAENTKSGYFILKGESGKTLRDAVTLVNTGAISVKLQVYAVDATTSQQSGAAYLNVGESSQDVGSWIKLEASEVEIAPSKQATVPFTITIPAQARTGQHLGGIAVQLANSNATSSGSPQPGFGVTSISRGLTAVLVNVGEAPGNASLRINGAQTIQVDDQPAISLALQNNGNSLIKPKGELTLTDAAGKTIMTTQLALDTFVPQTSINYQLSLASPIAAGTYRLQVSLDFGGTAPAVFDGPVVISAKPAATTKSASSTASPVATIVAGNVSAPAVNSSSVALNEAKSDGNSGLLIVILIGVCVTLLLVTVGLVSVVLRSRKRA